MDFLVEIDNFQFIKNFSDTSTFSYLTFLYTLYLYLLGYLLHASKKSEIYPGKKRYSEAIYNRNHQEAGK